MYFYMQTNGTLFLHTFFLRFSYWRHNLDFYGFFLRSLLDPLCNLRSKNITDGRWMSKVLESILVLLMKNVNEESGKEDQRKKYLFWKKLGQNGCLSRSISSCSERAWLWNMKWRCLVGHSYSYVILKMFKFLVLFFFVVTC